MSVVNDDASAGYQHLQNFPSKKTELDLRELTTAIRSTRDEDGGYTPVIRTKGPVGGGVVMKPSGNQNEGGWWGYAIPVNTTAPAKGAATVAPGTDPGDPMKVVAGPEWSDLTKRVQPQNATRPVLQKFPEDWPGVVVGGFDPDAQNPMFVPGFGGLVAVHAGSPSDVATLVYDLEAKKQDLERNARLHSLMRVYMIPGGGCVPFVKGSKGALALQYGQASDDMPGYGAIAMAKGAPPPPPKPKPGAAGVVNPVPVPMPAPPAFGLQILGAMSGTAGGPITSGPQTDTKHRLAVTPDGEPFNSAHIKTLALFLAENDFPLDEHDGPIHFTGQLKKGFKPPFLTLADIDFNPELPYQHPCGVRNGKWIINSRSYVTLVEKDKGKPKPGGGGGMPLPPGGGKKGGGKKPQPQPPKQPQDPVIIPRFPSPLPWEIPQPTPFGPQKPTPGGFIVLPRSGPGPVFLPPEPREVFKNQAQDLSYIAAGLLGAGNPEPQGLPDLKAGLGFRGLPPTPEPVRGFATFEESQRDGLRLDYLAMFRPAQPIANQIPASFVEMPTVLQGTVGEATEFSRRQGCLLPSSNPTASTPLDTGVTSQVYQSMYYGKEQPDLRTDYEHEEMVAYAENHLGPTVGRSDVISAQTTGRAFSWTKKPGESPYARGSANGAKVFSPPEVRLPCLEAPGEKSTFRHIYTEGTSVDFGLPDLETGSSKSAFRMSKGNNGLTFEEIDAAGAAVADQMLNLLEGGDLNLQSDSGITSSIGTSGGSPAVLRIASSNGTLASPTDSSASDYVGELQFFGYESFSQEIANIRARYEAAGPTSVLELKAYKSGIAASVFIVGTGQVAMEGDYIEFDSGSSAPTQITSQGTSGGLKQQSLQHRVGTIANLDQLGSGAESGYDSFQYAMLTGF